MGSDLDLNNIIIDNNIAGSGGGIYFRKRYSFGQKMNYQSKSVKSEYKAKNKSIHNYSDIIGDIKFNGRNTLRLSNVTISNNSARGDGGGI